jgi:hypothetical protein
MIDYDEYEIETETEQLRRIFQDGADQLEMGLPFETSARAASDFVYELDDVTKGLVILDLLVLCQTFESEIFEMKLREMEI